MSTFLGDDSEEKIRKDELRSIVQGAGYGFVFGGLLGGVVFGYRGFLFGMMGGGILFSVFAVLGAKAERRQRSRERRKASAPAQAPQQPSSNLPVRRRQA